MNHSARIQVLALTLLMLTGCSLVDDVNSSLNLYTRQQQGDKHALTELEEAASSKKGSAAFYAGLAYDIGIAKNQPDADAKALAFYKLSNAPAAKHNSALLLLKKLSDAPDDAALKSQILSLLNESAAAGNPESMMLLAKIYANGVSGIEKNEALSFQWYKTIVEFNKDPESEFALGDAYLYGRGVQKNFEQGFRYLESSAKFGNPEAKIALFQNSVGFDRLVWLLIAINADKANSRFLKNENLKLFSDLEIKKAKDYSLAWINAHDSEYKRIAFNQPIARRP